MSFEYDITCEHAGVALERVRYYPRQLMDSNTLTVAHDYHLHKARQHNRMLHGWGVVCGFEVKANPSEKNPMRVTVCPGYALSPQGDVIEINTSVNFDLASGVQTSPDPCANTMPCPPVGQTATGDEDRVYYLVVRYSECYSRPERVPPAGCGCDETACEYARIRDGFELKLLLDLPESHQRAAETDDAWCREIKRWANSDDRGPAPIPPCPSCTEVPWVVLAGIRIPLEATSPITDQDINYKGRRVLYSVTALQTMVRCV